MIHVEYDDGKPVKHSTGRSPLCTPRGRALGMYALLPDGTERPIDIGYMRVGEMRALESLLNDVLCLEEHASFAQVKGTGIPVRSRA